MQKALVLIIVLALGPCTVYANPTSKSEEGNDASIEQKNIIDLMQRNLKFESEKLNIENQITLAKLKKELKEINNLISEEYFVDKSDNTVKDQNNDEFDKHINEIMDSPIRPAVKPKVIMVSHIAGVRRFGVSDSNDNIILVAENSFFRVNGARYRVVLKNNQYIVVE